MSDTDTLQPQAPEATSLRELAILLIKHRGHHAGKFQLAVGFRLGVGQVMIGSPLPGVMVGIEGVNLVQLPDDTQGEDVVDAAEVNPKRKRKSATT